MPSGPMVLPEPPSRPLTRRWADGVAVRGAASATVDAINAGNAIPTNRALRRHMTGSSLARLKTRQRDTLAEGLARRYTHPCVFPSVCSAVADAARRVCEIYAWMRIPTGGGPRERERHDHDPHPAPSGRPTAFAHRARDRR